MKAVGLAAVLTMAVAAVVATSSASASGLGATPNAKTAMAGQPTTTSVLLCGKTMMPAAMMSGSSSSTTIYHFMFMAAGSEYVYPSSSPGANCQTVGNATPSGVFNWTIHHGNVQTNPTSPRDERGTEHGIFTLSSQSNSLMNGANGQVTNYDWNDNTTDACTVNGNAASVVYQSGKASIAGVTGPPCNIDAPARYDTHGGAQSGDHFWGQYGTVVYQNPNQMTMGQCPGDKNSMSSSPMWCFQAVLEGNRN